MSIIHTQDRIDEHARQAWAVAEFLIVHYGDPDHCVMSDEIMACLLENVSSHLKAIRELNAGQEAQS